LSFAASPSPCSVLTLIDLSRSMVERFGAIRRLWLLSRAQRADPAVPGVLR
jgi:hypothetical protein